MPGRITELSESQIVADALAELRRLRRALASSQMPTWTHDRFVVAGTPATTYQLTFIPYGINVLARTASGGTTSAVFAEGTDFSVDYATGIVTVSATLTTSDVIYVSYVTTGDLTALSGPADRGTIVDNFDRANSTSTLGTTSDGNAVWNPLTGTWGISSNTAYSSTLGSNLVSGGISIATVDGGFSDGTIQVTTATLAGAGGLIFRAQDVNHYFLVVANFTGSGSLHKVNGVSDTTLTTLAAGAGAVLAVVLSGSSIIVKINGTTAYTTTDTTFQTATQHGLWTNNSSNFLDNFSASA